MFECPNCAKNLKFDIASQQMKCDACESLFDPYAIQKDKDAESGEYFETNIFTCSQCGGQIISEDSEIASFCLFCGNPAILTEHLIQEKRPDYIIPFQKTKDDCKKAYQKMMKKAFFVRKEFKDEKFIDGFKGVYIPYWLYNLQIKDKLCVKGAITKYERDRVLTEKYNIFADVDAEFNGDYYDASVSFYDDISYALAPYDLEKRQKFTPSFLSGFYANCAEVDEFVYYNDAKEFAQKEIGAKLKQDNAFSRYKLYDMDKLDINFNPRAEKILYPVWFMSYRNEDKVAYATINGQSGKMVADFPVDEKKMILCSLLLAVPIFVILNMLVFFKQTELIALSLFVLFLSLLMYASELRAVYEKESLWMDKGIHNQTISLKNLKDRLKRAENSLPGSIFLNIFGFRFNNGFKVSSWLLALCFILVANCYVFQTTLWPLIVILDLGGIWSVCGQLIRVKHKRNVSAVILSALALVVSLIVLIFIPIRSFWYYGAAALSFVAIIWNFLCVINDYNNLAMRKMPQFNKVGGDDCA